MAVLLKPPEQITYASHWQRRCIFLGGGISGAPDWQSYAWSRLHSVVGLAVFNPRRDFYPMDGSKLARELACQQIQWEWSALRICDQSPNAILFWFCKETIQPITLLELGRHTARTNIEVSVPPSGGNLNITTTRPKLFVGVHPEYPRRLDVEIQLNCECPLQTISSTIEDLVERVLKWTEEQE